MYVPDPGLTEATRPEIADSGWKSVQAKCTPAVSPIAARVLARLPGADRERASARARQRRQWLAALICGLLGLPVCLASATSNLATHLLAWFLAADTAWSVVVRVLLGGLSFLPALSAACMCLVAFLLWRRLLHAQNRGLQ